MTTPPNFFKLVIDEIQNNKLTDTSRFNVSVNLFSLLKKASTDRQWLVKHLPYNRDMLELFKVFIEQEIKPKVADMPALQELDLSQSIPSVITTHHKILRQAFEIFIQQQLTTLSSFEYNIEKDGVLPIKTVLFYLEHALNLETSNEELNKLLVTVQDKLAQDLFFTATYLLMNQDKAKITSRIQLEWLASQFLDEEKAPVIEYIIGHWTRKVLIHSLIALSLKAPEKEPETDEEKAMVKEIIFSTKPEAKK